jgi:hypothetical protein
MSSLAPLLAAINAEAIKAIVVIAFFIIMGLAKLYAKLQQKNPAPPVGLQRPEQPVRANAADEIDAFLKRAAQARSAGRPQPVRPAQTRPAQARGPVEKPVQAEVLADVPVGGKIGKQVENDLDTREFNQRETRLGSEVAAADKQIDERLHQVFDHHVSKLELLPGEAATAPVAVSPMELTEQSLLDIPATFATGLTDLLADPDSVRQAIVMNEILQRPESRWA